MTAPVTALASLPEPARAVETGRSVQPGAAAPAAKNPGAAARCRAVSAGADSAAAAAKSLRSARRQAVGQIETIVRSAKTAAAKALAEEKPLPARLAKRFRCEGCEKVNACVQGAQSMSTILVKTLEDEGARLRSALEIIAPPTIVSPMGLPPAPYEPAWEAPVRDANVLDRQAFELSSQLILGAGQRVGDCTADIPKELTSCDSHGSKACRKVPYAEGDRVRKEFGALAKDVSDRQTRVIALLGGWLRGKRPAAPGEEPARLLKKHNEAAAVWADWLPEGLNSPMAEAEDEYAQAVRNIARTDERGRLFVEGAAGIAGAATLAGRGARAWEKARFAACGASIK
ncbi:MAG: hypothetical protein HY925_04335 [Elusimicrobia bacterium]|nr:hypothetical protein [Elusimicrobiota bacterium]